MATTTCILQLQLCVNTCNRISSSSSGISNSISTFVVVIYIYIYMSFFLLLLLLLFRFFLSFRRKGCYCCRLLRQWCWRTVGCWTCCTAGGPSLLPSCRTSARTRNSCNACYASPRWAVVACQVVYIALFARRRQELGFVWWYMPMLLHEDMSRRRRGRTDGWRLVCTMADEGRFPVQMFRYMSPYGSTNWPFCEF